MCIDYQLVNLLIKLSRYSLPLIDDLLVDFIAMWFMSLGMASGFWAVRMTERAKLISAFVCPFGHYQWLRMLCVRLPVRASSTTVWEFLDLEPHEILKPEVDMKDSEIPSLDMTVFRRKIPAPSQMGPALGRSSYFDDIAHGASPLDQLCEDLDALLYRLRYWNISVSLPKSEFGKLAFPFLSHEVSADGIRALPKVVKGIEDLSFPSTYKGVQAFLGSLNHYNTFIEDLPVVAAVLYEPDKERVRAGRNLEVANQSFEILKRKIVSTPLLRHPDRTKPFVIIPHANPWAACAYDTGRVLNESDLRYDIAEKEVLAILRILEVFRPLIHGSEFPVVVYTRYSVLKRLLKSITADGRHLKWGLELSRWTLEIHWTQKDEDGLAAILASGITPREHLDKVAETVIPAKARLKVMPPVRLEMLDASYQGYVLSLMALRRFLLAEEAADLPGWRVVKAEGHVLEGVTVNDAEYHGLIMGLKLAMKYDVKELVAVGDSRIVFQQAQGLINCNQPNLQRRSAEYEVSGRILCLLIHVKREFNEAADYLTSKTLVLGESWELDDPDEIKPSEIPGTPVTDAVHSDQAELGTGNSDAGIPESLAVTA
ncbi:LOW QUALITY PROTEIN: reverse transcriptase, partial [Phytophthora megakarya]